MQEKFKAFLTLGVVVLFLFPFPLCAVSDENPFTVRMNSRYLPESDVNAMSGEVEIAESEFEIEYEFKAFEQLPVTLSLKQTHIDINENLPVTLPSRLEGRQFGFSTKFPIPYVDLEHYFMGVDIFPSLYTDDWDWENSAFRIPFRAYVIYKPKEEFILVGGVSVRIDYDEEVLPVIGLIYKPNDRLSFNLASDDPNITYKINDTTSVFMEFGFRFDEYEVTRNGIKGVVLKYKEASSGVGVKYGVYQNLEASLSVGGVVSRRIRFRDDVGKVEPDSVVYGRGKLEYKF